MTSPDGITWTARVAGASSDWRAVTYAGAPLDTFVAVADNGIAMVSPYGY
jgi:hypothetical protein